MGNRNDPFGESMLGPPLEPIELMVPQPYHDCPIAPPGDRVIIVQDEPPTVINGIIMPGSVSEEREVQTGTVARIGEQTTAEVKVGDRVLFDIWRGIEFESPAYPGRNLRLLDSEEILAIITTE